MSPKFLDFDVTYLYGLHLTELKRVVSVPFCRPIIEVDKLYIQIMKDTTRCQVYYSILYW